MNVDFSYFRKYLLMAISVIITSAINAQSRHNMAVNLPNDLELVKKAKSGNADAQAFVGKCYYWGECGVKENEAEAFRWFQKSASKGSPYGFYYIGLCYSNGIGVSQNVEKGDLYFEKAVKILKERANNGDAEAQYHLALCYQNGTGVAENHQLANSWFQKSASMGNPYSKYECALVENDKQKAYTLLREAADSNIREAIFLLGKYFCEGIGCIKSIDDGLLLIKKAADMGDDDAQVYLALCYEQGLGCQRDLSKAISWFKIAADEHENYDALLEMGCKYRDGHGVNHNYNLAERYLKKASGLEDYSDGEATIALNELKRIGRNNFNRLPIRCEDNIYDLLDGDPFLSYPIRGMENAAPEVRLDAIRRLKREKIHTWGIETANKVASGTYDLGYTMDQIAFAVRDHYQKKYFDTPHGTIYLFVTHDRNFYFINNRLFAMIWDNGMTVGDTTLIRSIDGNVKFIRDF